MVSDTGIGKGGTCWVGRTHCFGCIAHPDPGQPPPLFITKIALFKCSLLITWGGCVTYWMRWLLVATQLSKMMTWFTLLWTWVFADPSWDWMASLACWSIPPFGACKAGLVDFSLLLAASLMLLQSLCCVLVRICHTGSAMRQLYCPCTQVHRHAFHTHTNVLQG